MISKVNTIALVGLEGRLVEVEVDISPGLFHFTIVGLAEKAVQESKERVIAAIKNSNFNFPAKRITVNLAPADLIKTEPFYDLPIAIGILLASRQIPLLPEGYILWGELSLDGLCRKTRGALAAADQSKFLGFKSIILPEINANEAGIIAGINVIPFKSLIHVADHFAGKKIKRYISNEKFENCRESSIYDLANVKGQMQAKRALEIVAAGNHNVLFTGSPGAGKTFLARCLTGILPEMQYEEKVEVTKIHSIAGILQEKGLIYSRPFRNPHHTCSPVALIGGGSIPRPGEISLAHRGVLFLDEFNEFGLKTLESLRQPLEDRIVNISRASGVMTFPANFMLIAAMNPCRCGYKGDDKKECICSQLDFDRYSKKISGPIVDRIDLQLHLRKVEYKDLVAEKNIESSTAVQKRVEKARKIQLERILEFKFKDVYANADLNNIQIKKILNLSSGALELIKKAIDALNLSARAYYRALKVARTIADLENSSSVDEDHIAETISYRLVENE